MTRLVRPEPRRQLVLIGGAASTIAHSSPEKSEALTAAAPPGVLINIREGTSAGAPNFSLEPEGKIAFDAPARVSVSKLTLWGWVAEASSASTRQSRGAAALSRLCRILLLLRAVTTVGCGGAGDVYDFRRLLGEVAKLGSIPAIARCMGPLGRLVVVAVLGANNEAAVLRLLQPDHVRLGDGPLPSNVRGKWPIPFPIPTRPNCEKQERGIQKEISLNAHVHP